MQEHRHAASQRVGDSQLVEPARDLPQSLVDGAALLEVHASLEQRPTRVLIENVLVDDHGSPQHHYIAGAVPRQRRELFVMPCPPIGVKTLVPPGATAPGRLNRRILPQGVWP